MMAPNFQPRFFLEQGTCRSRPIVKESAIGFCFRLFQIQVVTMKVSVDPRFQKVTAVILELESMWLGMRYPTFVRV